MERAKRNGLSLQSQKGSTGLLFSVRILAPILDGGLRHIVLASIQYSLGRHTYMPTIVAEFTCGTCAVWTKLPVQQLWQRSAHI